MIERVQLNIEWIEAWMIRNKFNKTEFAKHLGKSHSWWDSMKNQSEGLVKRKLFDEMCDHFGFTAEEALIKKADEVESPPVKQEEIPGLDQALKEYVTVLLSIDKRLSYIEKILKGSESEV